MKKRTLIISIVIVIALGLLIYRGFQASQKTKKQESAVVRRGNLEESLTISGQIKAEENVILRFQTSGKVVWVGVKEGDIVKKYQAIASLDPREVKKKLDKYLNTFLKTRTDFDQTQADAKDKALTDALKRALDKSQLDLNNAVLDVELQNLAVEFSRLITPIAGIVVKADPTYTGANIISTQAQYEIVNPKTLYFEGVADQTEVVKLKNGMTGGLTLDAYPDQSFRGRITTLAFTPKTEETGTVYAVKFVFPVKETSLAYKIGMTGDLTFTTKKKNRVLYLPIKFIKSEDRQKYVSLKKQTKVYITTGLETDNLIEITSGLAEGDVVYD